MKRLLILITFVLLLIPSADVVAQGCAMCRVAPESNMNSGGNVAGTLNKGILFLMAIPYLLLVAAVWYFFRKQISQKLKSLGKK